MSNECMELWIIKDFALYLLVLNLASFDTVNKMCCLKHEDIS